nr:type II toxin-antitoxin system HicB family antitoxin [Nodosilinea sp. TSF1-S3]
MKCYLEGMNVKNKEFFVVIERDEDGVYVGEVPQLKACYSQGDTVDELMVNIREVIELCLEELEEELPMNEFIGVQRLVV